MQTLAFVPSKVLNFIREDENTLSILHCLTKSRICPQYKTELANSGSRTLIRCRRLQVHRWLEMEGVSMDTNLHGRSQSFHSVHSRSCLRPARFVVCTHRCQPCSDAAFEEIDRCSLLGHHMGTGLTTCLEPSPGPWRRWSGTGSRQSSKRQAAGMEPEHALPDSQ